MQKIIHQMWIGPYNMLDRDKVLCDKIKHMNPDFEYMFWNNDNLPKLPDKLNKLLIHFSNNDGFDIRIADMIRLYIIYEYGGLYIDCDYDIKNPLNNLNLPDRDGFIHLNHCLTDSTICHSIHGFNKHHHLSKYILDNISDCWLGPHFFGQWVKAYLNMSPADTNDNIVHSKLLDLNILSNNSIEQLRIEWGMHHLGSATWLGHNQKKLEKNNEFVGFT